MKIAVLITVFNRKEKTLSCLKDLYKQSGRNNHDIDIYIVDGGSNDGTVVAVNTEFPNVKIVIEEGLYWAGGMRKAWSIALDSGIIYDLFWLVNDDTHLYEHALCEGIKSHFYSLEKYSKGGVYIESTVSPTTKQFSYGGRKLIKIGKTPHAKLYPNNNYQPGELGNANSLFVSKDVFDAIGGFCEYCTHGIADYDYTLRATKAGFPCFVTPTYCGECEDDHGRNWKSASVSLKDRITYLYSPKGLAYKENLIYIKRFFPSEYLSAAIMPWIKTLLPQIWDRFKKN